MEENDENEVSGPRNSFAPNDGYVPAGRKNFTLSNRRSSSRLSRRNSSRISLNMFNNFSYGMLRHMRNPEPTFMDTVMYKVWRKVGLYLPLTGFLAVLDFVLDWMSSTELITNDVCHLQIFGWMMLVTLTFLPAVYAGIKANDDERKLWERLFRVILGRPKLNPYEKWTAPKDDKVLWYLTNVFYVLFALFTHVLSQVKVHMSHASKVDYYMEYKNRTAALMKHLQEGKFVEFDEDELLKLKALQHRATQYIMYYTKYAKGRLKVCLIEDAIQYNIQMSLLIFTAFSPHVSTDMFDYSDDKNMGWMATMFYATPSTIRLFRLLVRVLCLFTSVLSMWIALYQTERFHEILRTNQPVALGRIIALVVKTVVEILMPTFTLVLFAMNNADIIPVGDDCEKFSRNIYLFSFLLYLVFPLGYTFLSHFLWAYILNLSNRDDATWYQTFTETLGMSIFSACLTVKYSRISGNDETTKTEFYAGPKEYLLLFAVNIIKFILPAVLMYHGLPSEHLMPVSSHEHHLAISDSMSFKYEFEHPIPDLKDPVINVIDYTDEWQVIPHKMTRDDFLKDFPWLDRGRLDSYLTDLDKTIKSVLVYEKTSIEKYKCNVTGNPGNSSRTQENFIQLTVCVWGPRDITEPGITKANQLKHFMIYASFGKEPFGIPEEVTSLTKLNAVVKQDVVNESQYGEHFDFDPKPLYEMRNDRLHILHHAVEVFCGHVKPTDQYNCNSTNYYTSFIKSKLGSISGNVDGKQPLNRMVDLYEKLIWLPPNSDNVDHLRGKILGYVFLLYIIFTVSYILAEIDFPVVSKAIRNDFIAKFYPYLLPAFLLSLAVTLTYMGIKRSTKAYCQINPDSDKVLFFGIVQLDCILMTKIPTSSDKSEDEKFLSMSKCGLGMFCKYCKNCKLDKHPDWRRIEAKTTASCIKGAKLQYDFTLLPSYVHAETWGALNKLSLGEDDMLTCYFDPELIVKEPIGPDIDPRDCPQVVRRIFKGANTDLEDKYIYKFGFLKTETASVLKIRENRKKIYGASDSWTNVPQRFPQPSKQLEELTFEDWMAFSWKQLSDNKLDSLKAELMTTDFPIQSCLHGNNLISGMSLYGDVEMKGMLLTKPKKRLFLKNLLINELKGLEPPDPKYPDEEYSETYQDELMGYTNITNSFSKTVLPDFENLIQRSLFILVDEQDDLAHRFHQPFEVPYFGYKNFTFEKYHVPTVDENDCTPDDIYSWDAPFEDMSVTECNGQTMPINHFFGGVPGDRKYTLVDGPPAKTHIGFNGCPAVYKGNMMIFGAGPDMHEYMHEMYNEYYNTWQVNRDRTSNNGCKSRIAHQLTDYATKFWQTDSASFKYVAPIEYEDKKDEYDFEPGKTHCTIRHVGQNYGRIYHSRDHYKMKHQPNTNIRSCALKAREGADEIFDVTGWHRQVNKDLIINNQANFMAEKKGSPALGENGYQGPDPVTFDWVDLSGKKVVDISDAATHSTAYTENGFTHPQLGDVFKKFNFVLPVHGINMDANKLLEHKQKSAETVATGQIIQAIIQNEGFDQIFSYLFTFKNCEKHDLEYTNLFKATVNTSNNTLTMENIRNELSATNYASLMRTEGGPNGSFIGFYKGQSYKRDWTQAVADWENLNAVEQNGSSSGYTDNNEYSFYRWTYFFDYEESIYHPGPEVEEMPDNRFSEETRLSNALLWLRDYDNSQTRRRELLKSTYLINRFSYPDSNQDGRKFIHGETHNDDAFSAFSPVAFAENPLSFVTPLRSERTDSANEMSQFVNDVMYTPQRWGVYPFKGVSMKYFQPVMEEYSPALLNITEYTDVDHIGHFWNWTYDDDYIKYCKEEYPEGLSNTHFLTGACKQVAGASFTGLTHFDKMGALGAPRNPNFMWQFVSGYFWYWMNENQDPVKGYLATDAKPHCFLASDHDIGGFFEPFYRDPNNATKFKGELNMTKYLEQHIWGQPNAKWRPDDPYFKDDYGEGPLTIMMNKSMFNASEIGKSPYVASRILDNQLQRKAPFYEYDPWKYGRDVYSSSKDDWFSDRQYRGESDDWKNAQSPPIPWLGKFNATLPWLDDRDRWYRQCNFLKSIELLNFNLEHQNYKNSYKQFNTTTFDNDFSVDNDGFMDAMLNLNKPCPVFDEKVWLFGRIRKTQEVRSRNTEEFNWNHLKQAGLHHATAGKIMPLSLSADKWLNNDMWNKTVLHVYGKHLQDTYGIPLFNDEDHIDLEIPLFWDRFGGHFGEESVGKTQTDSITTNVKNHNGDITKYEGDPSLMSKAARAKPLYGLDYTGVDIGSTKIYSHKSSTNIKGWDTEEMFDGFTHREIANTIPAVWGMNITKGNEMYVPPVYGANYGMSMFNDVEKTYPHPYTVAFTYNGTDYSYRGMVPNSISPQWGACVAYEGRLICLGGMICYHHSRKNAAFTHNRVVGRHDDSLLCDNLDDAPHNMAISPKSNSAYEWETSLSNVEALGSFSLPVGLLGHSAIVIKNNGVEQIHVFGGMWGKLSNYKQFKNFYENKNKNAKREQDDRHYQDIYAKKYLQTWDNSVADQTPSERRAALNFKPNQIWAPRDVSFAITHNAVGKLSLVYEHGKWCRGPQMNNRRFGHTSIYYAGQLYHIGGHYADGISNSMESWEVNASPVRKRRETWEEGIPYNPKPFLYDGWSYTNFDHDPTLQNYFFRNKQTYNASSSIFKDEDGTLLPENESENDFSFEDFFNGSFVNDFHGQEKPFFENVREAYMSEIKYAPCKYCIFDSSYNKSDTTMIQSLANNKIYKWNAAIPPQKGYQWNTKRNSFDYMKFDINRMDSANEDTSIFGLKPNIKESNAYFNWFVNFFPAVFNVPTKHVPDTFTESVSLDSPTKTLQNSAWLPDCPKSESEIVILPGLSLCNN